MSCGTLVNGCLACEHLKLKSDTEDDRSDSDTLKMIRGKDMMDRDKMLLQDTIRNQSDPTDFNLHVKPIQYKIQQFV